MRNKTKNLKQITDTPYVDIASEGDLDYVIENLSSVKERLKKAIEDINNDSHYRKITPYEQYVRFVLEYNSYNQGYDPYTGELRLVCWRYETEEESKLYNKRVAESKKAQLEREKAEFERLKKKFEKSK